MKLYDSGPQKPAIRTTSRAYFTIPCRSALMLGLLDINVQSDILNRVQESRARLETEIRKLFHEVSRIAEQGLARAKKVREEGVLAVEAELQWLWP